MPDDTQRFLCIHGHFYQPPRQEPFTEVMPVESGATPFHDYNEKITAECYAPNAESGNFDAISYDLGPTLARWLGSYRPEVLRRILAADARHREATRVGNAMAQAYNHTILPLATSRDKRTQIRWGLDAFRLLYGRDARGMWLPECAVDEESLDIMAEYGVTYTILAPWQAQGEIDPTRPYLVKLPSGRQITVFFYNQPLSGGVSFDESFTDDADEFARDLLPSFYRSDAQHPQLVLISTDGEVYGHHKQWRDKFLTYLVQQSAEKHGITMITLEEYLARFPATEEVHIQERTSWSCLHGVARWSTGCSCTPGSSQWKAPLRQALDVLARQGDTLFQNALRKLFADPWKARDTFLALDTPAAFDQWYRQHARFGARLTSANQRQVLLLMQAQLYQQLSYTSCAFFFEDLDRIEPRNAIAFARRAISLYFQATEQDLQPEFLKALALTHSGITPSLTGTALYQALPAVPAELLPDTWLTGSLEGPGFRRFPA